MRRGHGIILLCVLGVVFGFAGGWFSTQVAPDREAEPDGPAPVSQWLASETREMCLSQGMTIEEIEEDEQACLRSYWTIDRLLRSERLRDDWAWDNGSRGEEHCIPQVIEADQCGAFPEHSLLPRPSDPWWDVQAVRDPGRTTLPGYGGFVESSVILEEVRAARDSKTPVSISDLELAADIESFCTSEPVEGADQRPRVYSTAELEVDVRECAGYFLDWWIVG